MDKLDKPISIKTRCELAGVKYSSVRGYIERHKYENIDIDAVIQYYLDKSKETKETFSNLCKIHGIDYNRARAYKFKHPELSEEESIEHYKETMKKHISLRQKCKEAEVNYKSAYAYKKKHPELTDEQVIEHFKLYVKIRYDKLITYCKKLGLDYDKAYNYMKYHNATEEEAIIHYRPECYINWLGELIVR